MTSPKQFRNVYQLTEEKKQIWKRYLRFTCFIFLLFLNFTVFNKAKFREKLFAPFVQNVTYAKYRDLQKSSVHIATDSDCFYKLGFIIGNHRLLYYLISCSITPCVCFIINRQTWPSCCTQCLV